MTSLSSSPSPFSQEPSADNRRAASGVRQFYVSLVQAGFTTAEALHLTAVMVRSVLDQSSD